jgi:hypothetical protein
MDHNPKGAFVIPLTGSRIVISNRLIKIFQSGENCWIRRDSGIQTHLTHSLSALLPVGDCSPQASRTASNALYSARRI